MWNDTDIPLACLITFRCYGTWLHGDERGSTNRFRNRYQTSHLPPEKNWLRINSEKLKDEPVALDAGQRRIVEQAARETCDFRQWRLQAINVRTNHVHTVLTTGDRKPAGALNALKANATRKLRAGGAWKNGQSPWSDKGSSRYLWTEKSFSLAVEYVLYGQGDELPDFN